MQYANYIASTCNMEKLILVLELETHENFIQWKPPSWKNKADKYQSQIIALNRVLKLLMPNLWDHWQSYLECNDAVKTIYVNCVKVKGKLNWWFLKFCKAFL